ncbi:MAG: type II toxin-antitoxin system HicB family antitoxin [Leptospiraceae bacterium]|nr:type II toxin-antitoxin system HicB family antitoxin [Leptospiraceae bacterium]MCB1201165.1 type II toxin-antitoxin system HicB family antitoxin [Leptospiraceae bacterium]
MDLSIKVWQRDGEYVASCPELDIFTYGETRERATDRLKKVIVFYAETASQLGYKIDAQDILSSLQIPVTWNTESYVN